MKILHLTFSRTPQFTDPDRWLKRIDFFVGILEEMAQHCEVINLNLIGYDGIIERNGVKHVFCNTSKFDQYAPFNIIRIINQFKADVLILHGLIYPLQAFVLHLLIRRPVVFVAQHHAEKPYSGIRSYFQKRLDKDIDAYFFTSKSMASPWLHKGLIHDVNKVHEVMEVSSIFNPIDKRVAKLQTQAGDGMNYLWVGRLDENKDPVTAVKAFIKFLESGGEARLNMIFQEDKLLKEVSEIINTSALAREHIVLLGAVNHEELSYWYNSVEFIISTSHYEGSGVAVCEAMSCGCIPIVTEIDSFKMMTNNGECGLLFPPGDHESLYQRLKQSLELPIDETRELVLKQFQMKLSFKAISDNMLKVIFDLKEKKAL